MNKLMMIFAVVLLVAGCGGGDNEGGTVAQEDNSASQPSAGTIDSPSTLALNKRYQGQNGTFEYVSATMPRDGSITFKGAGSQITIFDSGMNQIGTNRTPFYYYQQDLNAGQYLIQFAYRSSHYEKINITAYSPELLPFSELPALQNGVYSSGINKTEYYRFSPTTDTSLNHSSSGVRIALYDREMNLIEPSVEQKRSPFSINAGHYIVELQYLSDHSKSTSISSPAL